jgi:hypothetical protein
MDLGFDCATDGSGYPGGWRAEPARGIAADSGVDRRESRGGTGAQQKTPTIVGVCIVLKDNSGYLIHSNPV